MNLEDEHPAALLTVQEVADRLRVHESTVRRWVKHGVLEAVPLPHRGARQAYRIRPDTLERLLVPPPHEQQSTQPDSPTTKEQAL
jgi:excisionase family DNA binding protein